VMIGGGENNKMAPHYFATTIKDPPKFRRGLDAGSIRETPSGNLF